jgi:hypothetical protein
VRAQAALHWRRTGATGGAPATAAAQFEPVERSAVRDDLHHEELRTLKRLQPGRPESLRNDLLAVPFVQCGRCVHGVFEIAPLRIHMAQQPVGRDTNTKDAEQLLQDLDKAGR